MLCHIRTIGSHLFDYFPINLSMFTQTSDWSALWTNLSICRHIRLPRIDSDGRIFSALTKFDEQKSNFVESFKRYLLLQYWTHAIFQVMRIRVRRNYLYALSRVLSKCFINRSFLWKYSTAIVSLKHISQSVSTSIFIHLLETKEILRWKFRPHSCDFVLQGFRCLEPHRQVSLLSSGTKLDCNGTAPFDLNILHHSALSTMNRISLNKSPGVYSSNF